MNLADLLMLIPRGLKAAAGAVASPFASGNNNEYLKAFDPQLGYIGKNRPAGTIPNRGGGNGSMPMSAGQSQGGEADTLASLLSILGSVGKTAGRVGNTIGRMAPVIGPYYQGAEYGILKGLGKEDSDWAGGNIFAESEKRREEQEAERQHQGWLRGAEKEKFGQEQQRFGWEAQAQPFNQQTAEQTAEVGGLQIGTEKLRQDELKKKISDLDAQIAAQEQMFGGQTGYSLELLKREREQAQAQLEATKAQTQSYSSLANYRDTRSDIQPGQMTPAQLELIKDRIKDNARALADKEVPEELRLMPENAGLWESAYSRHVQEGLAELSAAGIGGGAGAGGGLSDLVAPPENAVAAFGENLNQAMQLPEFQGMPTAQVAQMLIDSMAADGELAKYTPAELEMLKNKYNVTVDTLSGAR